MWSWINPVGLVSLGAGLALVGLAAVALGWWLFRLADRYMQGLVVRHAHALSDRLALARDEAQLAQERALAAAITRAETDAQLAIERARSEGQAAAVNMRVEDEKRGASHWGAVKAAEAVTSIAVELETDIEVQQTRLHNLLLRIDWIRAGGNPEANWNLVVHWHNTGRKSLHS